MSELYVSALPRSEMNSVTVFMKYIGLHHKYDKYQDQNNCSPLSPASFEPNFIDVVYILNKQAKTAINCARVVKFGQVMAKRMVNERRVEIG